MIAKRKGTQSKHLTSKETCYQFYKIICRAFKVAVPSCSIPVQTKMLEWLRSESKRESEADVKARIVKEINEKRILAQAQHLKQ